MFESTVNVEDKEAYIAGLFVNLVQAKSAILAFETDPFNIFVPLIVPSVKFASVHIFVST